MWAHRLSNPYLNVNGDPCGHVTGANFDRIGRFKSLSTPKSCSTFNTRPSLNMPPIGRGSISYSETWSLGSPYAGSAKIRLIHMGLLDHLWDDTVAGPRPENGLSKLRKHHTFNFRPSSGKGTTLLHISPGPRVLNCNREPTLIIVIIFKSNHWIGDRSECFRLHAIRSATWTRFSSSNLQIA